MLTKSISLNNYLERATKKNLCNLHQKQKKENNESLRDSDKQNKYSQHLEKLGFKII